MARCQETCSADVTEPIYCARMGERETRRWPPYLVERDPNVVVPEPLADAEPLRRDREDLGRADDLDVEVAVVGGGGTLDLGALPQAVVVVEHLDHVPGVQVARHRRGRRARPDRLPRDAPGHLAVAVVPPEGVRVAVAPRDLATAPRAHRRPGLLRPHLHRVPFPDPHRSASTPPPPPPRGRSCPPLLCTTSTWQVLGVDRMRIPNNPREISKQPNRLDWVEIYRSPSRRAPIPPRLPSLDRNGHVHRFCFLAKKKTKKNAGIIYTTITFL